MYFKMKHLLLAFLSLAVTQTFSRIIDDNYFGSPPRIARAVYDTDEAVDTPCTTPNGVEGTCVSVFKCQQYLPMYQSLILANAEQKQILKNARCGWSNGAPLVCCERDKQCGKNPLYKNVPKIAGGANSTLGAWPWMTALYVYKRDTNTTNFVCGGSLISSDWVLTAAHCIPTTHGEVLVHVRLGDLDLNETVADGANPIEVKIKKIIKHPEYSERPKVNDIALLQLQEHVPLNEYIYPICLHSDKKYVTNETIYNGKQPTVAGWGDTSYHTHTTTRLLHADLNIVAPEQCKEKYDFHIELGEAKMDETVLCTLAPKKDACQGDSGGPLMFIGKGSIWSQGGIVSYGYECATDIYPGVYTKVAAFTDWISNLTGLKF